MANAVIRVVINNEDDEVIIRIKKRIEELVKELKSAQVTVTIRPEGRALRSS